MTERCPNCLGHNLATGAVSGHVMCLDCGWWYSPTLQCWNPPVQAIALGGEE